MLNTNQPKSFTWVGMWSMSGEGFGPQDLRVSDATIRCALDNGYTQFDTAPVYGRGNADRLLANIQHPTMVIASKTGLGWDGNRYFHDGSPAFIIQDVHASLKRLKREAIDAMILHWPDPNTPLIESMGALQTLKDQGKVRAIGVSNVSAKQVQAIHQHIPLDMVQLKHSLLDNQYDRLRECRLICPSITLTIHSIFEQGLLVNPHRTLSKSDQRHRNRFFTPIYRELVAQSTLFGSDTWSTLTHWLTQMAHTIDGVVIGVRHPNHVRW